MTGISNRQRMFNEAKALGANMKLMREEIQVKLHSGTWTEEEALEKYVARLRRATK